MEIGFRLASMPAISHTDVHLIVTQLVKLVYLLNRGQGVDLLCNLPPPFPMALQLLSLHVSLM